MSVYVNPAECVHVHCAGEDRCLYLPEPIGPELPPLVLDRDGRWWSNAPSGTGQIWWYGSSRLVTWSTLARMLRGQEPMLYGPREGAFPWGPWIGADYSDVVTAETRMRELVAPPSTTGTHTPPEAGRR